ncbi:MAG: hypothetical protein H7A32_01240 [Deltaproteobacteria bacterium]|nr:hypothetical protein [Deltaproteobacteria bacterium]
MSLSVTSLQFQIIADALEYNLNTNSSYYNTALGADFAKEVDQFHRGQLLPVNDKDLRRLRRQQKTLDQLKSLTNHLIEFYQSYKASGKVSYLYSALHFSQRAMELLNNAEGRELNQMSSSGVCQVEERAWLQFDSQLQNIQENSERQKIYQKISEKYRNCTQSPEYQMKGELQKQKRRVDTFSRLAEEALAKNIKYESEFKVIDQFFNEAERYLNNDNPNHEAALACISRAQIYFNISYDEVKVSQKGHRPTYTQPVLAFKRVYCTENECHFKSEDPQEEAQLVTTQNYDTIINDYWRLAAELDSYRFARYRQLIEKIPLNIIVSSDNNLEKVSLSQ